MSEAVTTTQTIEEAAQSLAAAIQSDERWTKWQEVTKIASDNQELNALMDRYHALAKKSHDAQHNGPALTEEEVAEVGVLKKQVYENELFRQHTETTTQLMELLKEANATLTDNLGVDLVNMLGSKKPVGCRG